MKLQLDEELFRAAAMTFEELGFMFPTPDDGEEDVFESELEAVAGVNFYGPVSGRLIVTARGGLLPLLASSMFGDEDAPPRSQQMEALGEVANVICSNILPSIGGAQAMFQIESARVMRFADQVSSQIGAPTAWVKLALDEGSAEISLYVEGRMAA